MHLASSSGPAKYVRTLNKSSAGGMRNGSRGFHSPSNVVGQIVTKHQ